MKILTGLILILSLIVCIAVWGAERNAVEKTVLDYYLMLPDNYFNCEPADTVIKKEKKLSTIKKKDLKKGFIKAKTIQGGVPIEVGFFKDDYLGIDVIAVNTRCGQGCICKGLDLFFVSDGKLMLNEDRSIFPKTEDIEKAAGKDYGYEFILSDDGKGFTVSDEESGKVLLKIEWSGGRFNIK